MSVCLCVSLRYSSEEYIPANLYFFGRRRVCGISRKRKASGNQERIIYDPGKTEREFTLPIDPAFLFHPRDFLLFYDDDLNKHQTEREEREERMRASFSKRSRCCSSSCSSPSSSKFVYCSHFTSLELFFSIPNAVVIFVDFAFHSRSQISPYALGCPRSATKPRIVFSLKNPPARAHKK